MTYHVRSYQPGEERALWELFFATVRTVNIRDYTAEQVQAWAPDHVDEQRWRSRIAKNAPFVCVSGGTIVGFADLQEHGHIDQFFVHCQWQGRGVGKQLFATIESVAKSRNVTELTSEVSITARPFFEARGFVVAAAQEVLLGTVTLTNFPMRKRLRLG